jgi:hypothetical protein
MGFLDWMKRESNPAVRTLWQSGPYKDQAGNSVQACLGMSDKGYHAGLMLTSPDGAIKTTWHKPMERRDHAMEKSQTGFIEWVENHEAHMDANKQREIAANKLRRPAPSWER